MLIHQGKDGKHDDQVQEQNRQEMEGPRKGNAALEAHEQRGIAEGGQAAAHIGDQEDKEDHEVDFILAPGVRTDHGTDEQHGSTGRADPAGESRADK